MHDVDFNEDESTDYDLANTLYDIMESGNFFAAKEILADIGRFVTIQADNLRELNWGDMGEAMVQGAVVVRDSFSTLTEQESLLRSFTSVALIFCGGSWVQLASIFAAVE